MKRFAGEVLITLAVFLILVSVPDGFAVAGLEIIESTTSRYTVGTKLADADELSIPDGGSIKLLQTPSNKVYSLEGPYRGMLKNYKEKKLTFWEKWFGSSKEPELPVGGTRGFKTKN